MRLVGGWQWLRVAIMVGWRVASTSVNEFQYGADGWLMKVDDWWWTVGYNVVQWFVYQGWRSIIDPHWWWLMINSCRLTMGWWLRIGSGFIWTWRVHLCLRNDQLNQNAATCGWHRMMNQNDVLCWYEMMIHDSTHPFSIHQPTSLHRDIQRPTGIIIYMHNHAQARMFTYIALFDYIWFTVVQNSYHHAYVYYDVHSTMLMLLVTIPCFLLLQDLVRVPADIDTLVGVPTHIFGWLLNVLEG